MKRMLLIGAAVLLAGSLLLVRSGVAALPVTGRLVLGWWSYLARVLPRVTVAWDGVATALLCLALFTLGLHAFLRWFHREIQRQGEVAGLRRTGWPARRTVSLVAVLVVMFVAGIAAAGVVHQVGWLLTTRSAWDSARPVAPGESLGDTSELHLGFGIGSGTAGYVGANHRLPATRYDAQGHALHSWQAVVLPFMWNGSLTSSGIDYDRPWDDPRNSAYFRGIVPDYLNPEIAPIRSPEGYALSHYAGNRHVMGVRQPLRMSALSAGASNTILAGEVADGFKAWGDPTNLRDPLRGCRGTPEGFGNPSRTGANFLFGDGSVRFLSKSTSPEILGRFSVPGHDPSESPKPGPEDALGIPDIAL